MILTIKAGYSLIGLAVIKDNKVIYAEQCELRSGKGQDVSKAIQERAMYRRGRRNRKTRYRPARFLNRKTGSNMISNSRLKNGIKKGKDILTEESISYLKYLLHYKKWNAKGKKRNKYKIDLYGNSLRSVELKDKTQLDLPDYFEKMGLSKYPLPRKADGWLPPSVRQKFNSLMIRVEKVMKHFSYKIDKIVIELGEYDIKKLRGVEELDKSGFDKIEDMIKQKTLLEDYKEVISDVNKLKAFEHLKRYVKIRDLHICHYAKNNEKGSLAGQVKCEGNIEIDHINPISKGGTTTAKNLVCACHSHNQAKSNMSYKEFAGLDKPTIPNLKRITFLNIMQVFVPKMLKEKYGLPVIDVYGWETDISRKALELPKNIINSVIAIGYGFLNKPESFELPKFYNYVVQNKKNTRQLHKAKPTKKRGDGCTKDGRLACNVKSRTINGFKWCRNDLVYFTELNKKGFVSGFTSNYLYVKEVVSAKDEETGKYKRGYLHTMKAKTTKPSEIKFIKRCNNFIEIRRKYER